MARLLEPQQRRGVRSRGPEAGDGPRQVVGDDGSLERREILGDLVLAERRPQRAGLLAIRSRAGEQVDGARELVLAEGLAGERLDQPAHADERVVGRALRARLRTQHREHVVEVEVREQDVDQPAGAVGVERAHLLQ